MNSKDKNYWLIVLSAALGVFIGKIFDTGLILFTSSPNNSQAFMGYVSFFIITLVSIILVLNKS